MSGRVQSSCDVGIGVSNLFREGEAGSKGSVLLLLAGCV